MFTSFAQLASTFEASLSLDNLQNTIAGTIKPGEESVTPVAAVAAVDDGGGKSAVKPQTNTTSSTTINAPNGSNEREETEMQLVEEISRVSELLRVKDAECSTLQFQLAESKRDLQSGKLAFSDLTNELKSAKALEKSSTAENDDRANSAERIIADLKEEINHQKKISDDKSLKLKAVQSELAASLIEKEDSLNSLNSLNSLKSSGDHEGNEIDAQLQQLLHENAALKRECAQHIDTLGALSDATEQVRSLEGLLGEAKVVSRGYEDKLIASQREVPSLKETIESIQSEHLAYINSHKAELSELSVLQSKTASEAASQATTLRDRISALESEIIQQKAINNALKEMRDKQSTADNEKTSEIEDLYRSLSQASDSIAAEKILLSAAQSELLTANKNISEKNDVITDLQGKLTTLTDKMKDIVKKYGEMKAKNSSVELAGGEKSAEMVKLMQSKEAEVLSLRLKLEHTERGSADQRAMSSELAERYGEAQRELARSKANIQEHLLTIESQQQDIKERQKIVTQLTSEKLLLTDQITLRTSEKQALEELMTQLRDEKNIIQEQLKSGDDAARVLDEYKKRAQLALKKSNSASAAVSAELAVMRASVSEAQSRLIEAEESLTDAVARCEALEMDLTHTKKSLQTMQSERDKAISSELASSLTAEDAVHRVRELSSAMAAMKVEVPIAQGVHNPFKRSNNDNSSNNDNNSSNNSSKDNDNSSNTPPKTSSDGDNNTRNSSHNSSRDTLNSDNRDNRDNDRNSSSRNKSSQDTEGNQSGTGSSSSPVQSDSNGSHTLSSTHSNILNERNGMEGGGAGGGGGGGVSVSAAASRRGSIPPSSSSSMSRHGSKNGLNSENGKGGEGGEDAGSNEEGSGDGVVDDRLKGSSSDKLYYVNELYSQMDELRKEVASRGVEVESTRQELSNEIALKRKLEGRVEELLAYLDRSKKFQGDGPDSATNTEYLKNCVYRFMATTEHSERKRLAPVISTILKLTSQEKRMIEVALAAGEAEGVDALASIGAFTSSLGSFFGANPTPTQP